MKRISLYRVGLALSLGTFASVAAAQIDIVGDWNQPTGAILAFFEENIDRGGGPDLGDYAGLPINEALRYKARVVAPWLTMPEHQCVPHPSTYQYRSPGGLSILKENDPVTQRLSAYPSLRHLRPSPDRLDGWQTASAAERAATPSKASPPEDGKANKLLVETTHLKAGFIRRNGVAHSDRARMIEYFVRHGDYLTIVTAVDDPVYFDEPFVRSTDFKVNERATTQLAEFGGFVNGGENRGVRR